MTYNIALRVWQALRMITDSDEIVNSLAFIEKLSHVKQNKGD